MLKEADTYTEQLQEDKFGTRLFYLYDVDLVSKLVGPQFRLAYETHTTSGPQFKKWMSLISTKS